MRLGQYFTKGIWALADKFLPILYGFGFILFAIRVLPREEYGLFTLAYTLLTLLSVLNWNFILQPLVKFASESSNSKETIINVFYLNVVSYILFALFLILSAPFLAKLFNIPKLQSILLYLPILLFLVIAKNMVASLLQANQRFREIFWVDLVYFCVSIIMMAGYGLYHKLDTAIDLIEINCLAAFMALLLGTVFTKGLLYLSSVKINLTIIRKILTFGKYTFGAGLGNMVSNQTDTYLLGYFFDPVHVAVYNAAKIFFRIYNTFSQASNMLIFPLTSQLHGLGKSQEIKILVEKSICFFYILLIPLNFLLLLFTELIFQWIYSGKYNEAIGVFRIFIMASFFTPWGSIGSSVLLGIGKPHVNFRVSMLSLITNITLNLLLVPRLGVIGASLALVLTMVMGSVVILINLKRFTNFTFLGVLNRHIDFSNFIFSFLNKEKPAWRKRL